MEINKNISKNSSIGVIDSGIGGLTVLAELKKVLSKEKFIYVGDFAHFPYGEKTVDEICEYSLEVCDWLIEQGVKMIVIGCNTITAAALDYIRENVDVPVVGVIDAGVRSALEHSKNKTIGVLATRATIDLGIFQHKFLEKHANLHIVGVGAQKFVSFVENDLDMILNNPSSEFDEALKKYTKPLKEQGCDTVVLGCTHFPPLKDILQKELGADVKIVSPSKNTAEEVRDKLEEKNLLNDSEFKCDYYTTGDNIAEFEKFGSILMGEKILVCKL